MATKPDVELSESIFDVNATIDLFLRNSSQLSAEGCEHGVEGRLDIHVEFRLDRFGFDVNEHYWELNDFLSVQLGLVVVLVFARALEVENADVVERGLMDVLFALPVEDPAEVGSCDLAVLEAL